jgi:carbonic anhydrase
MKIPSRVRFNGLRLFMWVVVIVASLVVTAQAQEFGYHGDIGPDDWCNLSPDWATCCTGNEQSPININTLAARFDKFLAPLEFHFPGATSLNVVNNGHTVQANVPTGAGTLEIAGHVFNLLQFHFHTLSSHSLNGAHVPIEMHLVHQDATGNQTVVAVLVVPGKEDKELEKIWRNLPDEENEQIAVAEFHLHKLLPGKLTSYRYRGSLTTPPCSEGRLWNVFATPITMSWEQIGKFIDVFSGPEFPEGNVRPIQPLNHREVITDVKLQKSRSRGEADHAPPAPEETS